MGVHIGGPYWGSFLGVHIGGPYWGSIWGSGGTRWFLKLNNFPNSKGLQKLLIGKCRLTTPEIAKKKSSDEQFLKPSRIWVELFSFSTGQKIVTNLFQMGVKN
jgi:hypothetical protein